MRVVLPDDPSRIHPSGHQFTIASCIGRCPTPRRLSFTPGAYAPTPRGAVRRPIQPRPLLRLLSSHSLVLLRTLPPAQASSQPPVPSLVQLDQAPHPLGAPIPRRPLLPHLESPDKRCPLTGPPYHPSDKVDSTRAAVASSGALQNIGSYITGTIDALSATLDSSNQYISATLGVPPALIYTTAAAAAVALPVTMSRYGWSRSPYGSQAGGVPTVTEDDYTYITSQDLDDHGLAAPPTNTRRQHSPSADDDVLLIKSRGVNYPTHFPRHSIEQGKLEVRDVAVRAGLMMNLSQRKSRSLKFLYKGRQLKEQAAPVRDYGVRNNSVLMAILPEGDDRNDGSDEEMVVVNDTKAQRKNKRRKAAKKANGAAGDSASSSGGAKSPEPMAGAAGQRRIDEIAQDFNTRLLPMCKEFIANPPADPRKRKEEHTRISETVMQHVLLKLDEVDHEDNPVVRQSRKDLVRGVQDVLRQVDAANGPDN